MSCSIILDNSEGVYHPGDTVQGFIEYLFGKPQKVKGIIIDVTGWAHVAYDYEMTDTDSAQLRSRSIPYSRDVVFVGIRYYLVGCSSGEMTIPVGKVKYQFQAILPKDVPSSGEFQYGHVQYTVTSILHKALGSQKADSINFKVFAPLNLNSDLSLADSQCVKIEKNFGCFCCSSGPLSVYMKVPATGFVRGETIPIEIQCDNGSQVWVENLVIALRRKVRYGYNKVGKTDIEDIDRVELGSVVAGENRSWNTGLQIPTLTGQTFLNCEIIQVTFDLHLCMNVPKPHFNSQKSIEIVIGSVPFSPLNALAGPEDNTKWSPGNTNTRRQLETPSVHTPLLRKEKWYHVLADI